MQITLLCIGKTNDDYLKEGIQLYFKRLQHYVAFRIVETPDQKKWGSLPPALQKEKEASLILPYIKKSDLVVLLDEAGKGHSSVAFANLLQQYMNRSVKHLLFVVGGAYGFSEDVYNCAHEKLSLSKMTFSHQMVRLFFVEQLYRAMTILRGEAYHND